MLLFTIWPKAAGLLSRRPHEERDVPEIYSGHFRRSLLVLYTLWCDEWIDGTDAQGHTCRHDAFFASVEQRDDPALRGRPVAWFPRRPRRGGVAASDEASPVRRQSALLSVTALRRCPELVSSSRDSTSIGRCPDDRRHLRGDTSLIQPLSLDEAYLDVMKILRPSTAWSTAREIRARILEKTGLTASPHLVQQFLAKLASGHRSPTAQSAVTPDMGAAW